MLRLFVPLVFIFLISACNKMADYEKGNNKILTKTIQLDEFDELQVSGNFDVLLVESDSAGITITTDENLHEFITLKQNGSTLEIETDKNLRTDHGLEVTIYYTKINMIEVSGATTLENDGVITGDGFTLNLSGAGAIKLALEVDQLRLQVSGAGSVELEGKTRQQAIKMSGAGGLDARNFVSEYAKIDISGVGGAKIYVTETLDASVSGVGGISYRGDPKDIKRNISGLGSITKD